MTVPDTARLEPFLHPSAWTAADMADPERYTIRLDDADVGVRHAALSGLAQGFGQIVAARM
ncbi:MAG TPA: hypothetical protein PKC20_05215, partial [Burkholderiaceae bacterium]|nr:hypothetical protein [Burkholderiaceae bacterium]